MPEEIIREDEIEPGDIYEDTFYQPCICLGVEQMSVWGVSLVDGSYPRTADLGVSNVRKLTLEEAWQWKMHGPSDVELEPCFRWWKKR